MTVIDERATLTTITFHWRHPSRAWQTTIVHWPSVPRIGDTVLIETDAEFLTVATVTWNPDGSVTIRLS